MDIEIKRIVVFRAYYGPDHVYLYTGLPPALVGDKDCLSLDFIAARGTGKFYAHKHFPGIPVEVIA